MLAAAPGGRYFHGPPRTGEETDSERGGHGLRAAGTLSRWGEGGQD